MHIRFNPEDVKLDQITSRAFKQKCTLQQNMIFDKAGKPKKIVDGRLVDYGNEDDNG